MGSTALAVLAALGMAMSGAAVDVNVDFYLYDAIQMVCGGMARPDSLLGLLEGQQDEAAQCIRDTAAWGQALRGTQRWALKMLDSSSLSVPGFLIGNYSDLGNFDECVKARSDSGDIAGRYSLLEVAVQTAAPCTVHPCESNATEWVLYSSIRFAVCSPSSCESRTLDAALKRLLLQINETSPLSAELRLLGKLQTDHSTVEGLRREVDAIDWVIIFCTVFLVFVVLVATIIDIYGTSGVGLGKKFVKTFSARENTRSLLKISEPGTDNLVCVHGIRTLAVFFIIFCSRYMQKAGALPIVNNAIQESTADKCLRFIFFSQGAYAVDTLAAISGIVNCYAFLSRMRNGNCFRPTYFFIRRLMRINPGMMFVLGVSATWFSLTGNGPTWYRLTQMSEHCRSAWWTSLLHVGNLIQGHQCHVMWHMSSDTQMFLLSPIVLVPLWRYRYSGVRWLIAFSVAMAAVAVLDVYYTAFSGNVFAIPLVHWGTQMRITAYLIGTVFGFYIYEIQVSKTVKFNPTKRTVAICWVLGTAACLSASFLKIAARHERESGASASFGRIFWSLGISWVVLACVTSNGGQLNRFLSWGSFEVTSRLSFGVYLIYYLVQETDLAMNRTAYYNNVFKAFKASVSDFFVASLGAALLHLLVEGPTHVISNDILYSDEGRRIAPVPPTSVSKNKTDVKTGASSFIRGRFLKLWTRICRS